MAGDQSVALQIAQCLGEHALGDVADGSVKLAEALRTRREGHDHEHAPFVADAVEDVAHRTVYGLGFAQWISAESFDRLQCVTHAGSLEITWLQKTASLRKTEKVSIRDYPRKELICRTLFPPVFGHPLPRQRPRHTRSNKCLKFPGAKS